MKCSMLVMTKLPILIKRPLLNLSDICPSSTDVSLRTKALNFNCLSCTNFPLMKMSFPSL